MDRISLEHKLSLKGFRISRSDVGESARNAWLVILDRRALLAYLLMMSFDSTGTHLKDVTASSSSFEYISVLLLVSSVMFLIRAEKSLYYLVLAFGVRFIRHPFLTEGH